MANTLICRSFQSFMDICDNDLVEGANVHCTFHLSEPEMMQDLLTKKGGYLLTATPFLQRKESISTICL
ncbi:hypothetical protein L1D13_25170 [Vibrio tubiashii]|nr:hypothetical protein [Vibrio tubiashii]MCG9582488.1 hypothetical protein [Vibrio tubiashii]MCG9616079.1 hypothetical protein [Vibrio tubiashii]MCG9690172.1 hypothetical protein [Vibrio tubiashii]